LRVQVEFMFKQKMAIGLLVTMIFSGCIRDIEETFKTIGDVDQIQWDPTIAVPLINTRITISDFLKESSSAFIEFDEDNLIHVVYRDELVSLKAKQVVNIPEQHFDGSFGLLQFHINDFNTNGSTQVNFSTIFNFGIDGTEIDSIFMKACGAITSLTSDFEHDIKVKVTVPEIIKNSQPMVYNFDLPYDGTGSVKATETKDLNGSFFDLTNSGDQTFDQLLVTFEINITKVGNNPISTANKLGFETDFIYNEYDVLFGLIKGSDISPPDLDSLKFDLFKGVDSNLRNIKFRIGDPRIKVVVSNSYGIPIEARISEFSTLSNTAGKVSLNGYPDPLVIPTPNKQQIGQTLVDSFELNKTNSNIADVVSNLPQSLVYGYTAQANPPGTTERNFITYNSELKVAVDVDIPLHGSADGFVVSHEVSLDSAFTDVEDIEQLEEVTLRLFLQNDFPVDVDVQFYFKDENGIDIDSIFEPGQLLLRSATVDASGRITGPAIYTFDITMSNARFQNIRESKIGLVRARLNTYKGATPQPEVKFFSDYGLSVKLGIQAKAVINIPVK
jgi:hypothetical protein